MSSGKEPEIFMAGLILGVLIALIVCSYTMSPADECAENGGFVRNNQYYECRPTGEWVE